MVGMAGSLSNTILLHRFKFLLPFSSLHTKLITLSSKHKLGKSQFQFIRTQLSANYSTTQFNSHKTQIPNMQNGDDLIILGIETSCDDTAAAVVSLLLLLLLLFCFFWGQNV